MIKWLFNRIVDTVRENAKVTINRLDNRHRPKYFLKVEVFGKKIYSATFRTQLLNVGGEIELKQLEKADKMGKNGGAILVQKVQNDVRGKYNAGN